MDEQSIEYFREREQAERNAARSAACHEARRSHEELATKYAALIHQAETSSPETHLKSLGLASHRS
ncbi:hypothetical protein [Sphingomonas xanthus]|uniref:Uncharacterized protein n=1 Tax=Sphingomonas xanthus TaxID=2594473 RepID=A0A516ISN7_9SPHN|nr:hypothetical protein [Sphingomonas xanthus]QDP19928.1 hypothetical protein FMM02_08150 [Sphingomonas xanthus]